MNVVYHLKSSDRLKQEIKYDRIIDFIKILYTVVILRIKLTSLGKESRYLKPKKIKIMTLKDIKKNFPFSGKFGDCRLCSYIAHCDKILPGLIKPRKCGGPFFLSKENN